MKLLLGPVHAKPARLRRQHVYEYATFDGVMRSELKRKGPYQVEQSSGDYG